MKLSELIKSQDWTMFGIIASIYLVWRIGVVGNWSKECWILLLVCLLGVRKDQIDVDWKRFFCSVYRCSASFIISMGPATDFGGKSPTGCLKTTDILGTGMNI